MNWKIYDEAVDMMKQRFRFSPHVFRWRGRYYHVEAVERCWTVSRRRRRRRMERRYFQVQCAGGTFELYQDLKIGTWHLRRARLSSAPVSVVWPTVPSRRWKARAV
jgi:hypothetical protein